MDDAYKLVCEAIGTNPLVMKYKKLLSDRAAKRTAADIARRNRLRLQAEEKAKAAKGI